MNNKECLIPERLKKIREQLGITRLEAAKRCDLTQSGYVRYENGERSPALPIIEHIAIGLNTSVKYLIGLTDDTLPDVLVIKKSNDPILFQIVSESLPADIQTKQKLLAYWKHFSNQEDQK